MKTFRIAAGFFSLFISTLSTANMAQNCKPTDSQIFNKAREFFQEGQFTLSALQFSQLSVTSCDQPTADRASFGLAVALAELGDVQSSLKELSKLFDSPTESSRSRLFSIFITEQKTFESLSPKDRDRLRLWQGRDLKDAPAFEDQKISPLLINHWNDFKKRREALSHRSPVIAGLASVVIPGSGQLYAGAFQSAALAFVFNALMAATTLEFARKDLNAPALSAGMIFSITYIGNIMNAIDSAQRYNQRSSKSINQEQKDLLFPEFAP